MSLPQCFATTYLSGADQEIAWVYSKSSFSSAQHQLTIPSLGLAELFLKLAMLFRPGGLELQLFQTDESDVVRAHDFILALPRLDTKGVRVTVT